MLSPANQDFDLSTGRQIEIGAKQAFWDGKGEWTLAAYRIVTNGLVTRDVSDPPKSVQVGEQSSQGIEANVGLEFARDWRPAADVAMLRARYGDFSAYVTGVAVSRNGHGATSVPNS